MFDWLVPRPARGWPQRPSSAGPLPTGLAFRGSVRFLRDARGQLCRVDLSRELHRAGDMSGDEGPRTWTLPIAVQAYVDAERQGTSPLAGPVIFHCEHRAYGVGMFDTQQVLDGDALIARAAATEAADVLVGTVSHCHGALDVLHVGLGHAA